MAMHGIGELSSLDDMFLATGRRHMYGNDSAVLNSQEL